MTEIRYLFFFLQNFSFHIYLNFCCWVNWTCPWSEDKTGSYNGQKLKVTNFIPVFDRKNWLLDNEAILNPIVKVWKNQSQHICGPNTKIDKLHYFLKKLLDHFWCDFSCKIIQQLSNEILKIHYLLSMSFDRFGSSPGYFFSFPACFICCWAHFIYLSL